MRALPRLEKGIKKAAAMSNYSDYMFEQRVAAATAHRLTTQYVVGDKIRHKEMGDVVTIDEIRSANAILAYPFSYPMVSFEAILRDYEPVEASR